MKQTMIIMVGLPGSGKSTKGLQVAEDNEFAYVSRDNVRDLLGMKYSQQAEQVVRNVYRSFAEAAIIRGESVVVDATHLTVKSRVHLIELAKKYKLDVLALVMNTSYETCILRNAQRQDFEKVPIEGMRKLKETFVSPTKNEGFTNVYWYNENEDWKWD